MKSRITAWSLCAAISVIGISVLACGGEIVGYGNTGNRVVLGGALEEVAEALAAQPDTERVTDAMLSQIFSAILDRAAKGDPEAALIVLQVAEAQREQ